MWEYFASRLATDKAANRYFGIVMLYNLMWVGLYCVSMWVCK